MEPRQLLSPAIATTVPMSVVPRWKTKAYIMQIMCIIPSSDITPEAVERTQAEGIAIGLPRRGAEILDYIYRYKVKSATIPEEKILAAREKLSRRGIYAEHTTAAVYAGYLHYCEEHGRTRDALISMCGAGLKSDH